ncbi:uncharacterized protein JCM6883_003068, partial [Sporobolomyces salmoneus]|uniref:uncharacterized protein n=1 Tax=Sporobolomyces salmoneus TaxID=183962 RepID=UPI0031820474
EKGKSKQTKEEAALVELLSLASGQPGMRELVANEAGEWLEGLLERRGEGMGRMRAMAGVGIVKLRLGKKESTMTTGLPPSPAQPERPTRWSLEDIATLFVDLVVKTKQEEEDEKTLLSCLEGLAYLTLTPSRELKRISSRPQFLTRLFTLDGKKARSAPRDFAVATLLDHLTRFPSPEDAQSDAAQVERLKRFASAGRKAKDVAERESTEDITARVSLIVQHTPSPIPLIRLFCLSPSLQTRRLAGSILHSFVTPQPLRGQLLQSGVARLLLSLIRNIPTPFSVNHDLSPVQALSKLLITANPLLVFGPTPSSPLLLEATTALTLPFNTLSQTPLLAIFESLMALTNIASLDPELTDKIARLSLRDRPATSLL